MKMVLIWLHNNKAIAIPANIMTETDHSPDWDVVIVGAGPVGGRTGELLAQRGRESADPRRTRGNWKAISMCRFGHSKCYEASQFV